MLKVESLSENIRLLQKSLEEDLAYYLSDLLPVLEEKDDLFVRLIKMLYPYTKYVKGQKTLSKKDQAHLGDIIGLFFEKMGDINEQDIELNEIYKDINGFSIEEQDEMLFELQKEMLGKMMGVDLSKMDIRMDSSEEEIKSKIAENYPDIKNAFEEPPDFQKKSKMTKRQLNAEQKRQEAENLRSKSISSLYKQLAKVLHPDLQQDPAIKKEREIAMQNLTLAYREKDLFKLLQLEMEWLNSEQKVISKLDDGQLKIYIFFLKEQVAELEDELETLLYNPRYQCVTTPNEYCPSKLERFRMTPQLKDDFMVVNVLLKQWIEKLSVTNPIDTIKQLINEMIEDPISSKRLRASRNGY